MWLVCAQLYKTAVRRFAGNTNERHHPLSSGRGYVNNIIIYEYDAFIIIEIYDTNYQWKPLKFNTNFYISKARKYMRTLSC